MAEAKKTKVAGRWEIERRNPNASSASGIRLTFTRKGVEVFGWYDHFVGIDNGFLITWDELNSYRQELEK